MTNEQTKLVQASFARRHDDYGVRFDQATQQFVAVPIDLTVAGDTLVLVLYGTGLRGRSNLNAVNLAVSNTALTAAYAGATGLAGLDQIKVAIQ